MHCLPSPLLCAVLWGERKERRCQAQVPHPSSFCQHDSLTLLKNLGEHSRELHPPEAHRRATHSQQPRSPKLPGPDGSNAPSLTSNLQAVEQPAESRRQLCTISDSALMFKCIYSHEYYTLYKHTLSCQAVRANPPTKQQYCFMQMCIKLSDFF